MNVLPDGSMLPPGLQNPGEFLAEFWQKKPCLIRQAFAGFEPLLDGNDLAGLACEKMAESRLVRGSFKARDWQLDHGPFDEDVFATLPNENWTLLVQDVEKHYAPLQAFMHQFSFIPDWRLDDLMISYAATGGSVGPHVDQYDVFLLQFEGARRWQIASTFEPRLLEDCPLNVLQQFHPEKEWVLQPGDMLYLPPNIAHHGVALEPGMTWSVGCRAPSAADLLQGLGEWLAHSADEGARYSDPGLKPAIRAGEINAAALKGLTDLMRTAINDDNGLESYLAVFMSRFRLAHEVVPAPRMLSTGDVQNAFAENKKLYRNPWTRLVWFETPDGARLFVAGEIYECSIELAETLCKNEQMHITIARPDLTSLRVLTRLINAGHFMLHAD